MFSGGDLSHTATTKLQLYKSTSVQLQFPDHSAESTGGGGGCCMDPTESLAERQRRSSRGWNRTPGPRMGTDDHRSALFSHASVLTRQITQCGGLILLFNAYDSELLR